MVADHLVPQHLGISNHSADICICFQQSTVVNGLKTKFTELCFHNRYSTYLNGLKIKFTEVCFHNIYIVRNQHTTTDCLGFN